MKTFILAILLLAGGLTFGQDESGTVSGGGLVNPGDFGSSATAVTIVNASGTLDLTGLSGRWFTINRNGEDTITTITPPAIDEGSALMVLQIDTDDSSVVFDASAISKLIGGSDITLDKDGDKAFFFYIASDSTWYPIGNTPASLE
jgi:hypothetical protein